MEILVDHKFIGQRVDVFLSSKLPEYSRSQIQRSTKQERVEKDGQPINQNYKVQLGDVFDFNPPLPRSADIVSENIPISIVYEDEDVLVVNKKAGMVVHPAAGNWSGTLANGVLGYFQSKGVPHDRAIPERVGIVHRLDKDTSGIIIVAKDDQTLDFLQKQFQERTVIKKYYALVFGLLENPEGIIQGAIGRSRQNRQKFTVTEKGKQSETYYKVTNTFKFLIPDFQEISLSFLEVSPKTGRTHQIRVHLSQLGHSVLGDQLYGKGQKIISKKLGVKRQLLHARSLEIVLPSGQKKAFLADMPKDMKEVLNTISKFQ